MKAIFESNRLIVNTFDASLRGQPLFGKILEINLETNILLSSDARSFYEKYEAGSFPAYCEKGIDYWNALAESTGYYQVIDFDQDHEYFYKFVEITDALEDYYDAILDHLDSSEQFMEIQKEYLSYNGLIEK